MAQEQTKRGGGGGDDDDVSGNAAGGQERRDKLAEETDDLLDEIDDVLEENAEDFQRLADRYLAGRAQVYSTFLMPFMVVVKSPPRAGEVPPGVRAGLAALREALPSYHRTDLKDLRTFFRLGGLASPLLG